MAVFHSGTGYLLFIFLLLLDGGEGYVRVCYYTNWSQYRAESARFVPENVDPYLCTHIVFAFAGVQGARIRPTEYNDEEMYRRLTTLKTVNPNLRVLLSVGGWLAGGARFSQLVSSEESMQRFVGNAARYLREHGLDGLDVDWEFPGSVERGSHPEDRIRFTRLLQLLREGFDQEAAHTEKDRLLLTAAVAGDMVSARQFYQIPHVARAVDYIHLMAYDFYGQWDLSQGARHHSALYPDVRNAVEGWLQEGTPRGKLVLGVPAFSRIFVLTTRPVGSGVGQTVIDLNPAQQAPGVRRFSADGGLLTYQQVCELLTSGGWRRVWLEEQLAPVAFGNITTELWGWGGYDDVASITAKAKYVTASGLAGAMLWSMTNDDFNNRCRQGPWPLLSALRNLLPDHVKPEVQAQTQVTPANRTTATPSLPPMPTMKGDPNFADHTRYWRSPLSSPSSSSRRKMTTAAPREGVSISPTPLGSGSGSGSGAADTPGTSSQDDPAGYQQCRISDNFGPSLRCPGHRGKSGSRTEFYLYCFDKFFAIQCACLPGFFYNRCLQACDADNHFISCPFLY